MTKKSNTSGCLVAIVIQIFVFIIAVFIGLSEPTTGGFSQPIGQGLVNAVFMSFFIGPALIFTFLSFTNFPNSSGSIVLALVINGVRAL